MKKCGKMSQKFVCLRKSNYICSGFSITDAMFKSKTMTSA